MTIIKGKPSTAPTFDADYKLFPEWSPAEVFANDIALLMSLTMQLPAGPLGTADERKHAATNADTCIGQFLETDSRACEAGLLSTTSTSAMIFMNLSWLMMGRLEKMVENDTLGEELWDTARKAYYRLTATLGVGMHDVF